MVSQLLTPTVFPLGATPDHHSMPGNSNDKVLDVAKQFEALLLFTMMKSMRESLSDDPLFGSDQQDMYREMMDREIAKTIAEGGGLGLQTMLENQLAPEPSNSQHENDSPPVSLLLDRNTASLEMLTRQRLLTTAVSE